MSLAYQGAPTETLLGWNWLSFARIVLNMIKSSGQAAVKANSDVPISRPRPGFKEKCSLALKSGKGIEFENLKK